MPRNTTIGLAVDASGRVLNYSSVADTAARLGLSAPWIRRLCETGAIAPPDCFRAGRDYMIATSWSYAERRPRGRPALER